MPQKSAHTFWARVLDRTLAGGLTDRIGARWVAFTGFAIVGLATVPFAAASATTSQWFLIAVLVLRGFGLAAVMIPLTTAAFVGLRRGEIPHAGIISRVAQQIGGSFGVAVLAVILDAALHNLGTHSGSAAEAATAFDQAFWWAVGFTGIALVLSLMLSAPVSSWGSDTPAWRRAGTRGRRYDAVLAPGFPEGLRSLYESSPQGGSSARRS